MIYPLYKYSKTDRLIAAVLAAVILLLCLGSLNYSCVWGDDSAAYISEGIAIANGTFKEHIKLTPSMPPSVLGSNVKDELVYVWGYPLLLSVVYLINGFDMDNYSNIIVYKLPSAIFLSIMACCFFLLLRRRFSLGASVFVTCFFCSDAIFTEIVNSLYSDIVYMGMCMLTLIVIELYLEERVPRKRIIKGIITGVVIWYSAEVRTNGTVFIAVLLIAQLIEPIRLKHFSKDKLLPALIPYAVFLVLKIVTEQNLLSPVTVNSADIAIAPGDFIIHNILYYFINLFDFTFRLFYNLLISPLTWFFSLEQLEKFEKVIAPTISVLSKTLTGFSMAMAALGIFTDGINKNQYLTLYLLGCAIGTCIIPYNQGLRYMLGIMPIMVIFSVYGYRQIYVKLCRRIVEKRQNRSFTCKGVIALIIVVLCAASCTTQFKADVENIRRINVNGEDVHFGSDGMYSPAAIEVYSYIKENTPADALIAFHKPRAMYLNTGRLGFSYLVNNNNASDADYCILPELFYYSYVNDDAPEWFSGFEVVFRNNELTIMKNVEGRISISN